jgi:hypothetical protein
MNTEPLSDAERELVELLVTHFPHGYRCGESCDHHMNSPEGWAGHVADLIAGWCTQQLADAWDAGYAEGVIHMGMSIEEHGKQPGNPYRETDA